MFGPPFTLPKVILLCALAVVLWGYFFWQMRSQWVKNRRRREFMAEGGLRPQRRSFDRRKMLQIVFIGVLVLAGGLMAYFDRFGTPSARDLFHLVEVRVAVAMKYLGGAVVALVVLYVVLYWLNRDRALVEAAKRALAGKHAEAEAIVRGRIAAKGANERRLTVLGVLLMEQKRLDESLVQLQEAQRLSKHPATAKNNCATVLWKLGRREEAAQLLDEVCAAEPGNFAAVCNSCLILGELGRTGPAFERLEQAERIFERYDAMHTKHWVALLEECRKVVPRARGFEVVQSPRGDV